MMMSVVTRQTFVEGEGGGKLAVGFSRALVGVWGGGLRIGIVIG